MNNNPDIYTSGGYFAPPPTITPAPTTTKQRPTNTRYANLRMSQRVTPTLEEELAQTEAELSARGALTPLPKGLSLEEEFTVRRGQLLLADATPPAAAPPTKPTPTPTATAPTSKLMHTTPPFPAPKPSTASSNVLAAMSGTDAELYEFYQKADSHNCSLIDADVVACARVRAESRRRHSSDK